MFTLTALRTVLSRRIVELPNTKYITLAIFQKYKVATMAFNQDASTECSKVQELPFPPRELTAEQVKDVYRQLSTFSVYTSDCVLYPNPDDPNGKRRKLAASWTRRMINMNDKFKYTDTFHLERIVSENRVGYTCVDSGQRSWPQRQSNSRLWYVISPSGKRCVTVYKEKDSKNTKKDDRQFFEIWTDTADGCGIVICVSDLDVHGDVVGNDGQFGSVQWSPCERFLLYVAEKKKPKVTSFFDSKPPHESGKETGGESALKGEEFVYCETWGEQLVERHTTVLCVLDISSKTVTLLSGVPENVSPGQAIWCPDNQVVFVGWCQEPYRLGLRFCTERESFLYRVGIEDGECEKLSEDGRAVRCPSFSPDLSRLVYLDTPVGGPHNNCSRLVMINWLKLQKKQLTREIVVDVVNSPYKTGYDPNKEEFPGLYTWADLGLQNNWLSDSVHIIIPSYVRSCSNLVLINTDNKAVRYLYPFDKWPLREGTQPPASRPKILLPSGKEAASPSAPSDNQPNNGCAWSSSLLCVRDDDVLITCSWPDKLPSLVLGSLSLDGKKECGWVELGRTIPFTPCFDWQIYVMDPKMVNTQHKKYDYLDFEAILYMPHGSIGGRKPPLVLFPHGGPHSVFDSDFQLNPAVFAQCGFAVLCVNFRGSLGFGQDSIDSLLGGIGDLDVKDCMQALDRVKQDGLVDLENVFVYGGSHGGFLSAHLVGQYPDVFRAASMRNPVINLPSMCGTTDIRDWPFVEVGLPFSAGSVASGELLTKLWEASPIRYIDQVKTPVMLNIGLKDLRVPPSQGLEYYKALRARNVPVKCLTYPESNHSLAEVDVEGDSLVNTILWFAKHLV